jgi:hypothetical protein
MELNKIIWDEKEYNNLVAYFKEISDDKYKNFHKLNPPLFNDFFNFCIANFKIICFFPTIWSLFIYSKMISS